ncbi:MAG: cystathionine beta-synthase [Actinomycetia bacterium]|nr:cystathionine beta-synthase [Actinomycetes bacterium]
MRKEFNNVLEAIGRTPLVKLNRITENIKSTIYVKLESLNPGGSVKDRIALQMIEAAEKDGHLKPGGTIVEATAGNTGVGLAMAAAIKGYRTIFVMPDKMSGDKISLLRSYGAEVVIVPTSVPPDSPESYNGVAGRLAKELPGAYRPHQFENPNNPRAHYLTTGPEIWEDSAGKVEIFVAGMGTGGTISGVSAYLKEKNPDIEIVGADPEGSILSGDSPKSYMVEGIGEDFIPKTFNRQLVDHMVRVSDKNSFNTARRLAREEGLLVGGSSGTAVAGALSYARRLKNPKYIVVLLPDTGRNYLTKIFSDQWMKENEFWEGKAARTTRIKEVMGHKRNFPALIAVTPQNTLAKAVKLMQKFNISQLPVIDGKQVAGGLDEASVMKLLHDGTDFENIKASSVMGSPLPMLEQDVDMLEAYRILLSGNTAIVVASNHNPVGVITRVDLINYWSYRRNHEI